MENAPKLALSTLAAASTGLFAVGGMNATLGAPFFVGLGGVALHYAWQISTLDIGSRESCWNRFVSNRSLGLLLTFAILGGKFVRDKAEPLRQL